MLEFGEEGGWGWGGVGWGWGGGVLNKICLTFPASNLCKQCLDCEDGPRQGLVLLGRTLHLVQWTSPAIWG